MDTLIDTAGYWNRVKSRLRAKGITYENAALLCGFNTNTFRNWAGKNIIPSAEDTFRLSRFLGLSMEFLMNGETSDISAELEGIRGLLRAANKRLDALDCHFYGDANAKKSD